MSTFGGSLPATICTLAVDLRALRVGDGERRGVHAGCAKVNDGLGSVSVRTTAPFGRVIVHW